MAETMMASGLTPVRDPQSHGSMTILTLQHHEDDDHHDQAHSGNRADQRHEQSAQQVQRTLVFDDFDRQRITDHGGSIFVGRRNGLADLGVDFGQHRGHPRDDSMPVASLAQPVDH